MASVSEAPASFCGSSRWPTKVMKRMPATQTATPTGRNSNMENGVRPAVLT